MNDSLKLAVWTILPSIAFMPGCDEREVQRPLEPTAHYRTPADQEISETVALLAEHGVAADSGKADGAALKVTDGPINRERQIVLRDTCAPGTDDDFVPGYRISGADSEGFSLEHFLTEDLEVVPGFVLPAGYVLASFPCSYVSGPVFQCENDVQEFDGNFFVADLGDWMIVQTTRQSGVALGGRLVNFVRVNSTCTDGDCEQGYDAFPGTEDGPCGRDTLDFYSR